MCPARSSPLCPPLRARRAPAAAGLLAALALAAAALGSEPAAASPAAVLPGAAGPGLSAEELLRRDDPNPVFAERPDAIKGMDVVENLGAKVPLDLVFTNSDGRTLPLSALVDGVRPTLLLMVYYRCPMQCGTILQRLSARLNALDWAVGDKFNVVVVSFDPTEVPAAAAKARILAEATYVRGIPAERPDSWVFMTASARSARALATAVGFPYRYLPDSGEYSHPAVEFVLTPDGRVSRYLYGIDYPVKNLRFALLEATDGKIGSTFDRILHFCFRFDPNSNAYVLQAFRVMQVGAAATVLGLGGLFAAMWGLERARRRRVAPHPAPPDHPAPVPTRAPPGVAAAS